MARAASKPRTNVRTGISKAPAAITNTLKGVGGGKSAVTKMLTKPFRLIQARILLRARPGVLVKHRLPALPRKVVKKQAACDRAERGHRRVIRHSRRIADRKINQQQIVDHRKRQDGRIEKRDEEKAQPSRGGDNRLKPVRQMKFRRR